jgi:hypothetical protein
MIIDDHWLNQVAQLRLRYLSIIAYLHAMDKYDINSTNDQFITT